MKIFNPRSHYLTSEPAWALGATALLLNVLLIILLLSQIHAIRSNVHVSFGAAAVGAAMPASEVIRLEADRNKFRLDGREFENPDDLAVALSGRSTGNPLLLLRISPRLSSADLASILALCARAGFTRISIETPEENGFR